MTREIHHMLTFPWKKNIRETSHLRLSELQLRLGRQQLLGSVGFPTAKPWGKSWENHGTPIGNSWDTWFSNQNFQMVSETMEIMGNKHGKKNEFHDCFSKGKKQSIEIMGNKKTWETVRLERKVTCLGMIWDIENNRLGY